MADPGSGRPLIAIPARFSESASALRYRAVVAARGLIEMVHAAGGEPLVTLPVAPDGVVSDDEVRSRLAIADGVLLPGGGDIDPKWSGQAVHETQYDVDVEQDAFDLAVARVCLADGIPLLAICRGLQVVNVARGGTLIQDMDELSGPESHHRHRRHDISVDEGSLLHSIAGPEMHASCYHHQALASLGEGMEVTARAEEGVIEAVEIPAAPGWFLGLQWHPEDTWREDPQQLSVVRALVEQANIKLRRTG